MYQVFYNLTTDNELDLLTTESVPQSYLEQFLGDLRSIYNQPQMITCNSDDEAKSVMATLKNTYKMAELPEPPSGLPENLTDDSYCLDYFSDFSYS